ncbi:MAG: hypothetical protein FWH04_01955 [Oscillospiraceae bacterium]|nr:hypothetical protein [Oscillospiraceae bacterium]
MNDVMSQLKENKFTEKPPIDNPAEERFASDWGKLLGKSGRADWELLLDIFVELSFPVEEGQSENPAFLAALKRGELPCERKDAWMPVMPEGIRVYLHPTPAGRLPVIECEADEDFIRLHRSIVCRCEPKPVPDSRGATIVKNYNNWARVNMNRSADGAIPKDPSLYRDYIALLSHRYYSGVDPEAFGMAPDDWHKKSLIIRREHESAHYMTQRFYNSAKNEIHDEIIADFMGLTATLGEYDPVKFLTFLGLENAAQFRKGGRLEIYLGGAETESGEFDRLCETVRNAARNISGFYKESGEDRMQTFHALCRTSVADMAEGKFDCGRRN